MKQFNKADAERLVQTYSDLILRLKHTLASPRTMPRTSARISSSSC